MVPVLAEFQELFAYNRWANHRLLDAAAALPEEELRRDLGSSFPSVLATLAHVAGAEWVWMERWSGRSPTGFPYDPGTTPLPILRERWLATEGDQLAFLASLTDDGLAGVVAYRNLQGVASQAPLYKLMRHTLNHSTYHRGQISTLMRQLGRQAPSTDLIVFYRTMDLDDPAVRL